MNPTLDEMDLKERFNNRLKEAEHIHRCNRFTASQTKTRLFEGLWEKLIQWISKDISQSVDAPADDAGRFWGRSSG